MNSNITWKWLELRLVGLNAKWLESEAKLYRGKLGDVKRGQSTLTNEELQRVQTVLSEFFED